MDCGPYTKQRTSGFYDAFLITCKKTPLQDLRIQPAPTQQVSQYKENSSTTLVPTSTPQQEAMLPSGASLRKSLSAYYSPELTHGLQATDAHHDASPTSLHIDQLNCRTQLHHLESHNTLRYYKKKKKDQPCSLTHLLTPITQTTFTLESY